MDVTQIYTPVGCSECINGYKGRVAVHEVLEVNQEIRDAIVNNVRKDELRKLVYGQGCNTLLKDGLIKVIEGNTSMEEILKVIDVNDDFGADEQELKDAIIGKTNTSIKSEYIENPFIKQNIETL